MGWPISGSAAVPTSDGRVSHEALLPPPQGTVQERPASSRGFHAMASNRPVSHAGRMAWTPVARLGPDRARDPCPATPRRARPKGHGSLGLRMDHATTDSPAAARGASPPDPEGRGQGQQPCRCGGSQRIASSRHGSHAGDAPTGAFATAGCWHGRFSVPDVSDADAGRIDRCIARVPTAQSGSDEPGPLVLPAVHVVYRRPSS